MVLVSITRCVEVNGFGDCASFPMLEMVINRFVPKF